MPDGDEKKPTAPFLPADPTPEEANRLVQALRIPGIAARRLADDTNLLGRINQMVVEAYRLDDLEELRKQYVVDASTVPTYRSLSGRVIKHEKQGVFTFDPAKVSFYRDQRQVEDANRLKGKDLYEGGIRKMAVLNLCVRDHLIANPHIIPDRWKTDDEGYRRRIFFWGTILRDHRWYVAGMEWRDGVWGNTEEYFPSRWYAHYYAAIYEW